MSDAPLSALMFTDLPDPYPAMPDFDFVPSTVDVMLAPVVQARFTSPSDEHGMCSGGVCTEVVCDGVPLPYADMPDDHTVEYRFGSRLTAVHQGILLNSQPFNFGPWQSR